VDFFKDKSQSIYLRKIEVHHSNFFKNKHPVNGCKTLNADMLKSVQITYFGPFTKLIKGSKYLLTSSRNRLKERDELARNWKDEGSKEHLFHGVKKKAPKGGRHDRYQERLHLNKDLFLLICSRII